jgi:hypothetical protein
MPSDIANRLFPNLKKEDAINEDIIKDKKTYKGIKTNDNNTKQKSVKRMGRPPKEPGTRKENLSICIEPKYRAILKKEAEENGYDELGPYIVKKYIVEQLKKKYKDL